MTMMIMMIMMTTMMTIMMVDDHFWIILGAVWGHFGGHFGVKKSVGVVLVLCWLWGPQNEHPKSHENIYIYIYVFGATWSDI